MPPKPKVLPEALKAVTEVFSRIAEPWASKIPEATKGLGGIRPSDAPDPAASMQVLGDMYQDMRGSGGLARTDIYGKNSLAVKKDLLNKHRDVMSAAVLDPDADYAVHPRVDEAQSANSNKKYRRREYTPFEMDWGRDYPHVTNIRPTPLQPEVGVYNGGADRADIAQLAKQDNEFMTVAGPQVGWDSKYVARTPVDMRSEMKQPEGSDNIWRGLMHDPAFPKIAATVGAGAAAGYASQANAATPPDDNALVPADSDLMPAPPDEQLEPVTGPSTPAPMMSVGQPAPTTPAQPAQMSDFDKNMIRAATPPGALGLLEEKVLDPVIRYGQEKIGKPLVDAGIKAKLTADAMTGNYVPGSEYLMRVMAQPIAGKEQYEHYVDTPEGLKDVNQLEDLPGGAKTAAVLSFVTQMAGEAPLYLIGPKKGLSALESTVAGGMTYGALSPDTSILEGGVTAGAMHAGNAAIETGVKVVGKAVGEMWRRAIHGPQYGVMSRDLANTLADALAQATETEFATGMTNPRAKVEAPSMTDASRDLTDELQYRLKVAPKGALKADKTYNAEAALAKRPEQIPQNGPQLTLVDKNFDLWDTLSNDPMSVQMRRVKSPTAVTNPIMADVVGGDAVLYGADHKTGTLVKYVKKLDTAKKAENFINDVNTRSIYMRREGDAWDALPAPIREKLAARKFQTEAPAPAGNNTRVDKPSFEKPSVQPTPLEADTPSGVVPPANDPVVVLVDQNNGVKFVEATERPEGWGKKATATEETNPGFKSPGGPDIPEPPPPEPPGPPPSPPPFDNRRVKAVASLRQRASNAYQAARRLFVQEGLRTEATLGDIITDHQNLQNWQKHQVDLQNALEKVVGDKRIGPFREAVYEWAELRKTDEEMRAEFPDAWKASREILRDWENTNREQQKEIVKLEGIPEDYASLMRNGKLWRYVTRSYGFDTLPAAKRLKILKNDDELMERAVKGFMEWSKNKGKTLDENDARARVWEAIKADDPASVLFDEPSLAGPDNANNLRKRNDELPDWYRKMLLQNRDGFYAVARTDAVQKSTIQRLRLFEKVAENPNYARTTLEGMDPSIADEWKRLPMDRREYGKAAGMYLSPEVYDSLYTLPNIKYTGNPIFRALTSIMKTNWFSYGKARTYLATVLDNFVYGQLAGGVDPFTRPVATKNAIGYVWKSIAEYHKNPLADNEFAYFIREARRIGPDEVGHIGPDIGSQQRQQERYFIEEMAKLKWSDYASMLERSKDAYQKLGKPGSWIFETSDRVHRLASWKMISDDLMLKGMEKEPALRTAARRIFQYYPTYSKLAPLAKYLNKTMVGDSSPTTSFGMERNRIYGSLPFRLIDDPGLKWRLMKIGLIGFDMFVANDAAKWWLGTVKDEDINAANQELGFSKQMFSPGVWYLPGKVNDQVVPVDLTQIAGPLQYLAGDPELGPMSRVMLNATTAPFQGGLLGAAIDTGLNTAGIKTGFPTREPLPGDSGTAALLAKLGNAGAVPGFLPDLTQNVQNTGMMGDLTRKQEVWPTSLAVARTMGIPIQTPMSIGQVNNPSFQAALSTDLKKISDMEGIIKMAAQWPEDKQVQFLQMLWNEANGDVEKQKVIEAAIEELTKAAQNIGKTGELENAARRIGVNKEPEKPPRRIGLDK